MKKAIIVTLLILAILLMPVAWYLISPLFIEIEKDEASPLDQIQTQPTPPVQTQSEPVEAPDDMPEEIKEQFEEEMEKVQEEQKIMEETMPTGPTLLAQSLFQRGKYDVMGEALLIDTEEGKVLRFENFETVNGPELHIYLAKDIDAKEYKDLGIIKATKGNVNYDVPDDIDTSVYDKVLVWCEPFRVLFSYADLGLQN